MLSLPIYKSNQKSMEENAPKQHSLIIETESEEVVALDQVTPTP